MLPFLDPVRATFRPEKLPGLAAWYSADFGVLSQVGGATAFASASSQKLEVSAASLNPGTQSFSISFWLWTNSTHQPRLYYKRGGSAGVDISLDASNRIVFFVGDGSNFTLPVLTTALSNGQWNYIYVEINQATKLLGCSVNNGALATSSFASVTGSITTGATAVFASAGASLYLDGKLDEVGIWSRVLNSTERTFLYNSGQGRTYSEADASLKTNLVSWWSMNAPASGDWLDSHGSNNLTPSVSRPTATEGVTFNAATEGQTVRRWLDRSGNGRHLDQATLLNQPVLTAASTLPSGFPAVTADGATSLLQAVFPDAISQPFTVFALNRVTGGAGNRTFFRQNGSGTSAVSYASPSWNVFAGNVVVTSYTNTVWNSLAHYFSGTDSFTSDGLTFSTGNVGTAALVGAGSTLNIFGNGANFWGGNLSEFLIYTGPMSQTDAAKVLRYLRRRGGL